MRLFSRSKFEFVSPDLPADTKPQQDQTVVNHNQHQQITPINTLKHRIVNRLPAISREKLAELFLRRPGKPGPAIEHAMQYLLSIDKVNRKQHKHIDATTAAGADRFYEKQYRQFLNPTMGAFAMTATQAILGAGGSGPIPGWRAYRRSYAAVVAQTSSIMPIWALNNQTVAIPLLLPELKGMVDSTSVNRWLEGKMPMPDSYQQIVNGEEVRCHSHHVHAYERSFDGSILELMDAVRHTRKLAVLALHPHDPDAMGLHITLFGITFLNPIHLAVDYGLSAAEINTHIETAGSMQRRLVYCVGGTEEVFTQCSQNLFAKIPLSVESRPQRAKQPHAWSPTQPLQRLISRQFEMIQVTVSAAGLPGASPRNGDHGKAAFVAYCRNKPVLLIPYHSGNSVHGHAAKLWSNPYATFVVSDDHVSLTRVIISGPSRILTHRKVIQNFPSVAQEVAAQTGRTGMPIAEPEYWFLQEVAKLVQELEPLPANQLTPGRNACTINAGGMALHNKKPAYFAADSLPAFDQALHHYREHRDRPLDPEGVEHRHWLKILEPSLTVRQKHLKDISQSMPLSEDKCWNIRS
ncbi:MAG: hypothetical protein PHO08_01370 [Methylococcales bacterium]|nr:hypothetical protein [Methylococcales bacterium]MDD5633559.1 hypothetical protein [Methylococcales bacterium]